MDRILTPAEVEKIKRDLVALYESGNAPQDLIDHLKEMGMDSPDKIPTGAYRAGIDRLSSGHWRMIADKWLEGIPGEPSIFDSAIKKIDDIINRINP
jgi:hypothetical protein